MTAPLEKTSIWGMLAWESAPGDAITPHQRFQQVAPNAAREAWLWGDGFYDEVVAEITKVAQREQVVPAIESKESIAVLFSSGSMETWDA
jgi:hypothetical protein